MAPTTTKIARWGNSQGIMIPRAVLREAGLEVGDRVEIGMDGASRLTVAPARRRWRAPRRVSAAELFADYEGAQPGELDWGAAVGAEVVE